MEDNNPYVWGYHLSLDMAGCDQKAITSKENIIAFTKALVKAINMKAYGEPECVHFAEHDPGKAGYTMTQLIETSNICAHFVDATGEVYLDVFSCKDFDPEAVVRVADEYFKPTCAEVFFRERGASLDMLNDEDIVRH
jgi:S-adenosylmethionine/arginine decarboxylase-like enzyme